MTTVITSDTGEIQPRQHREQEVQDILKDKKVLEALLEVLPKHLDTNRFARIALGSLRRNPKLLQCTPQSFLTSLLQCAALGLEPDTPLGHAYLIPYGKESTLVVGYEGYIDLAYRSGVVVSIHANVVREGDLFEWYEGSEPAVVHQPKASPQFYRQGNSTYQSGRDVTHAYAIAKLLGGGHVQTVLLKSEIDALKSRSRAAHDGPWVTDPVAMMRKTAIRQLRKFMPMSPQARAFHVAAGLDEQADAGLRQAFEVDGSLFSDTTPMTENNEQPGGPESEFGSCPDHNAIWSLNKFGFSHKLEVGFCTPSKLAWEWAGPHFSQTDFNTWLKEAHGITRSKIEPQHLESIRQLIEVRQTSNDPNPVPLVEHIAPEFVDIANPDGTTPWPE